MQNPKFFTPIYVFLLSILLQGSLFASGGDNLSVSNSNASITGTTFEDPTSCGVPTWPSTSNITNTSATFSWSPVSGAESYSVQTRVPNGTWYTVPGSPFTNTTVTVDWFLPNTTYQWRVSANCWGGEYSYWTAPITFTTSGYYDCEPPSWLETNYITESTATFDWSAANGAISYSIQWRVAGGTWADLGGGPWQNTWLYIGGLQPNTTYEWRVRSNCGGGMSSGWSYTETFTTLGYSCGTPTWPSTSNITNTSATFSWSSVGGAQSYTVQTRLLNGTWYDVPGGPFNSTWVTVNGLSPNTTYQWRVRANCGGGQYSAWTSAITFTTLGGGGDCHAPNWLGTSEITQTSAKLSWSAVSGAHFYTIQYRIVGSNSWINLGGGPWNGTWHTITGLQPATTYEWRVRSTCDNYILSPWSYPVSFTTLGGYSCDTPTWPSTSNITSNSATFSWSSVYGALNYTVQIREINGNWYDVPGSPTNSTWITVNNLNPNTTYQWRVRTNCNNWQYSYWTDPVTFTTTGGECHAPYWLNTSNINQTSATLSWSAVNGAHYYTLQYRISGGTWYNVSGGPWNGTWHTLTGLQPGTSYEWRVRSTCDNYVLSPWSYPAYFTTLGYACSTPTWPSTSNITQTSANFSWSSVYGAHNYTVQIRLLNGQWYDLPNSPTYNNWITASNLTPGTTYQWRVRTTCTNWQYSYWTDPITFTTLGSYCEAPSWLSTSNITHSSATLNWSAVPGAHFYTLQYRTAGGTWYDVYGGPWYGTWHTITGLQPGTAYEWRVRSTCDNYVLSPWSYPSSFVTSGYTCYTPTWPSTSEITQTTARLSWSAVSSAASYSVEIRTPTGSWAPVPGSPVTSPWIIATGLNPGTTYQWRVRANCVDGGYSNWTYPVSFTTINVLICYAPSALLTNNITETSANLDWSAVNGAWSYDLQYRLAGSIDWIDVTGGPFTETWHVLTGLTPGTHYEWRVRSNCHSGTYSEWSNIAYFSTIGLSCLAPESIATSDITETSATFTWLSVVGAESYSVQTRVPNGTWSNAPGSPYADTTVIVGGFIPGTTYHWRVRANCGTADYSAWTSYLIFTTSGGAEIGQNECDSAKILNVNTTCESTSSSNVGATESSPPPMGWCPDNNYKDVWFKFVMPDVADPVVTIRTTAGTLTDAVMEVYRGGGCADLEYIYCEDDNSQGNGSTMPVITITGNANETIWVRVWGYAGTKGTFSICVFDYQSNNFAAPDDSDEPILEGEVFGEVVIAKPFNDHITNTTLQVFPNPTRDVLQVMYTQTTESTISRIVMLDMSGRTVFNKQYLANDTVEFQEQVDVSGFAQGIYLLQAVTSTGIITEKISVID